ncbi:MAG: hypothetical protein HC847_02935 [Hydrococcus sp. RU_2_2]|nr:hypothetical protein [Hydrococcus sp. RU_2_2]
MNRPSALWWTAGGVGLALAIGGGLFFVSGLMAENYRSGKRTRTHPTNR